MERAPKKFDIVTYLEDPSKSSIWAADSSGEDSMFPLSDGARYMVKYGVPRKLYKLNNPEKPFFEARDESELPDNVEGIAIFEIENAEGIFDARNGGWKTVRMEGRDLRTLERSIRDATNLPFCLYDGDGLYQDGRMIFSSRLP
jgi:hypothetical protein